MTKRKFVPAVSTFFKADSAYHGEDREMKVSIGTENGNTKIPVWKVQIVKVDSDESKLLGRQSPSFTDDDMVQYRESIEKLKEYLKSHPDFFDSETGFNGSDIVI